MTSAEHPIDQRPGAAPTSGTTNLAEILERVLDKGIVIAGDIKINLLDIELLTIKLRLIVASVDKAREMGIDWWEHDRTLSNAAGRDAIEQRLERLENSVRIDAGDGDDERRDSRAKAARHDRGA
jgi:hypothetical protein